MRANTTNTLKWLVTCTLVAFGAVSSAAAQKISEERIQELIHEAAARAGVESSPTSKAAPGTPAQAQSVGTGANTTSLSVDEAIKLALDKNLDIAVQRLNPQTFDFSIAGLQAIYRPTLTSTVSQLSLIHI